MDIHTNTLKVQTARKHIVELLLSEHRADCTNVTGTRTVNCRPCLNEFSFGDHLFLDLVKATMSSL
ncbi:MAG: hypothetical protein R2727_01480 [Bacteroidales bacterium]